MIRKAGWLLGMGLLAGGVQAANVVWDGSESIYWGNADNWNVGYLPGATEVDSAILQTAAKPTTVATNFSVATYGTDITIRNGSTLNIQADWTNWDQVRLGHNAGHYGFINHSAGTVGAEDVVVGSSGGTAAADAVYTMTGGTLDINDQLRARLQGQFNQSGGTVAAASMLVESTASSVLSGGDTAISGAVTINSGGSASVSGTAALTAGAIITDGSLAVSGGTVKTQTLNANADISQSGSSSVTAGVVNVGSGAAYSLMGGTLSMTGAAHNVAGLIDMTGGMLSVDQGPANVTVNGDGLLQLSSGGLESTGTAADDVLNFNMDLEVSGGTVDLNGQNKFAGEFKVIGGAAVISIDRLNVAANSQVGDFVFEFDEDGISSIENGNWMNLSASTITVDGSAYTGGEGTFTLFDTSSLVGTSAVVSVTGFTGGLNAFITQDQDSNTVTLTVIPEPAAVGLIIIFGGGMLFTKRRFNF